MFEFFGTVFTIFVGICIGYFGKKQIDVLLRSVVRQLKELDKDDDVKGDSKPKKNIEKKESHDKKDD